jgi:hypothetical protein
MFWLPVVFSVAEKVAVTVDIVVAAGNIARASVLEKWTVPE